METSEIIPDPALVANYANRFARWQHGAVREHEGALTLGDGSHESVVYIVELLLRFAGAPTPRSLVKPNGRDPCGRLLHHITDALKRWEICSKFDVSENEAITQLLATSIEPFFRKLLAMLIENKLVAGTLNNKRGLAALFMTLLKDGRVPYDGPQSDAAFRSTEDWGRFNSYSNAIRDVVPERNFIAHGAVRADCNVLESALAVLLGTVNAYVDQLTTILGPASTDVSPPPNSSCGVPAHRKISDESPEPFTTRKSWCDEFVAELGRRSSATSSVAIVDGVFGWGKSFAICKALENVEAQVRFIDLTECRTSASIAEAILTAFECPVTAEERRRVDNYPLAAVSVSTRDAPNTIVVLENSSRNHEYRASDHLASFVDALRSKCMSVIVEAPNSPSVVASIPQDSCFRAPTLPKLEDHEVVDWFSNVLGREPSDDETAALLLCEGVPRVIRNLLEVLHSASRPDDADDADVADVADVVEASRALYTYITELSASRNQTFDGVPDVLWCWLGILPAVRVARRTPVISNLALKRAQMLGLIRGDSGTWSAEPWGTVIALRHLYDKPSMISSCEHELISLAALLPPSIGEQQLRRTNSLCGALGLESDATLRILNAIPTATTAPAVLEPTRAPYRAPEDMSAALSDTSTDQVTIGSAQPTDEVLAWTLESAARTGRVGDFRRALAAIIGSPTRLRSIRLLRSMQLAMKDARFAPQIRHSCYADTISAFESLEFVRLDSTVLYTKLLLDGAKAAANCAQQEAATEWTSRAKLASDAACRLAGDSGSEIVADLRYETADLAVRSERTLGSIVAARQRAVESIPPADQWGARAAVWARRLISHLRGLVDVDSGATVQIEKLRDGLLLLPSADDRVELYAHFLSQSRSSHVPKEVRDVLREMAEDDFRSNAVVSRATATTHRCLSILLGRVKPGDLVSWARQSAVELLSYWDPDSALLFRLSLDAAKHAEMSQFREQTERLVTGLPVHDGPTLDHDVLRLKHDCVRALIRHHLRAARKAPDLSKGGSAGKWRALIRATRRIDRTLERAMAIPADGALVEYWTRARISLARWRHATIRAGSSVGEYSSATDLAGFLARFCEDSVHLSQDNPQVVIPPLDWHLARLLVAQYLWDVDAAYSHISALLEIRMPQTRRINVVRTALEYWAVAALIPDRFRLLDRVSQERDLELLSRLLDEFCLLGFDDRERSAMSHMALLVRDASNESVWSEFEDNARRLVGLPADYWARLSRLSQSREHPLGAIGFAEDPLDELTDIRVLRLIALLARYGAARDSLPHRLRASLASLAVSSVCVMAKWKAGGNGKSLDISTRTLRGTSIAIAIDTHRTHILLGTELSPTVGRDGGVPWVELAKRDMNSVSSQSVGTFVEIARHLKEAVDSILALNRTGKPEDPCS